MKIGVLSDSHGAVGTVQQALSEFQARGVELIIHCGDIDDASTVRAFAGWNCHFVFGNCDADRAGIRRAVESIGGTLHDPFGQLELAGRQVAWLHGDNTGMKRDLELINHYDYLFYGHTHVAEQHLVGRTLVINPGALYRARQKTCLVLDLPVARIEPIVVEYRG
jgi:putative phosphoesterase